MSHVRFLVGALTALCISGATPAQFPPETADRGNVPVPKPLKWKWVKLEGADVYFHYVARPSRTLILVVPAAPGDQESSLDGHVAEYLHDQGFALGVLSWRGDRSRRQAPAMSIAAIFDEIAQIRAQSEKFGFDPARIVVVGSGESALPAALISADHARLTAEGIDPPSICATVIFSPRNLDPENPDTRVGKKLFGEHRSDAALLAPGRFAATAAPMLIMTELFHRGDERRAERYAQILRNAGRIVVRAKYPRVVTHDPQTYLGRTENRATQLLGDFLRAQCPAKPR